VDGRPWGRRHHSILDLSELGGGALDFVVVDEKLTVITVVVIIAEQPQRCKGKHRKTTENCQML